VISDTFDALNRNTARSISLATGFIDTTSESRTFDALDRILTNDDNDYKLTYTYGVRGLSSTVYEEKQEYATGTAYQKVVTTKYDAVGNRTYEAYPSSLTLTYSYNDINALSSVTDGTNSIASMTYVGFRPKVTTFGNSTTATYSYGGFREDLTTIHHETSTPTTLVRLDYGYNKLHDRTYERYGTSGSAGDAFEYDKARRLTKAWMGSSTPSSPSGNTYVKTIQYNMDDDGNRTSVVTTPYGVSPTTESYTTNTLSQYTAVGGASPTYDGNGNLTDNGTYKFKYNYKNLICEARLASNNNLVATYTIDALGQRVGKAVTGGGTERFVYADVEAIETFDGGNGWLRDLVVDVNGVDRPLMLEQADVIDEDGDNNVVEMTRSYCHTSAVGSIAAISTASQAIGATYRYLPYGEWTIFRMGVTQPTDPLGLNRGYCGRTHDMETGQICLFQRALCDVTGRLLQRASGTDSDEGPYQYVLSDPINSCSLSASSDAEFGGGAWRGFSMLDQWVSRSVAELAEIPPRYRDNFAGIWSPWAQLGNRSTIHGVWSGWKKGTVIRWGSRTVGCWRYTEWVRLDTRDKWNLDVWLEESHLSRCDRIGHLARAILELGSRGRGHRNVTPSGSASFPPLPEMGNWKGWIDGETHTSLDGTRRFRRDSFRWREADDHNVEWETIEYICRPRTAHGHTAESQCRGPVITEGGDGPPRDGRGP
jgi:hypothetical protein